MKHLNSMFRFGILFRFLVGKKMRAFLIQTKLKHRLINNAIKTGVYSNLRPQNLQRRPVQNSPAVEHADLRHC